MKLYFPGAQAAIDATECKVRFCGNDSEETVKLKQEVAIDLASGAILGTALRKEEDSAGVERVVVHARRECEKILSVLADLKCEMVKLLAEEASAVRKRVSRARPSPGPRHGLPVPEG